MATEALPNSSSSDPVAAAIHQAIRVDLQAVGGLLGLLEQEQEAMQQRDRSTLSALVDAKTKYIKQIEDHAAGRYQILRSLDRPAIEAEWKTLVAEYDNPPLRKDWAQLMTMLEQCRHHNEVNGRLISRSQQTLNKLLNILRGQFETPELYNNRGATEAQQHTHRVTKA